MAEADVKLSICITTFNRAEFIGSTLMGIVQQLTEGCEIVVLDGGSTDGTEQVVQECAKASDRLRYIRRNTNQGFDRDCDLVVQSARGEYCWLMSDDDLLKPGAVHTVLQALRKDPSLVFVNLEIKDFQLSSLLQRRYLAVESDRSYAPTEMDRLFTDLGNVSMYVGGFIIKRSIWIARNKEPYYGSWFIHVGVIFQQPLPGEALIIAEPLISYRCGNSHTFSARVAEIALLRWPALIDSLPLSPAAKKAVQSTEPWRHPQQLLMLRARGHYTFREFRKWVRPHLRTLRERLVAAAVAIFPGTLINTYYVLYFSKMKHGARLHLMRESRFYIGNWAPFLRRRAALQ